MKEGIAVALLVVAAIAAAWLGFQLTETYGGFLPWIAYTFALTLGVWVLVEVRDAG